MYIVSTQDFGHFWPTHPLVRIMTSLLLHKLIYWVGNLLAHPLCERTMCSPILAGGTQQGGPGGPRPPLVLGPGPLKFHRPPFILGPGPVKLPKNVLESIMDHTWKFWLFLAVGLSLKRHSLLHITPRLRWFHIYVGIIKTSSLAWKVLKTWGHFHTIITAPRSVW